VLAMMTKWILILLAAALAIGINMPDNMLARHGIDSSLLTVTLAAVAFTAMVAYHKLGLALVMVALLIGANLPESIAQNLSVNRDVLLATLIALIVMPFVQRHIED
jgi:hypothetical protein